MKTVAKRKSRSARPRRVSRRTSVMTAISPPAAPSTAALSSVYVESSGLLAALLEQDPSARETVRGPGRRVTSALTLAEAARGILRARVAGRLTPDQERTAIRALRTFERRCTIISITETVLTRAGRPFPVEPIRTLDAIHLATLELLGEAPQLVTVVTRDTRVRENAQALGYALA
jgi:predicted nucleic acid-binding protein